MDANELAKPDNGADTTITLRVSGNRLVSVLNALDQAMHETGRYRFEGDTVKTLSGWFDDLRATTEAMRDELSRQRNGTSPQTVCGQCGATRHLVCLNCL